jgi:hypothetical protein
MLRPTFAFGTDIQSWTFMYIPESSDLYKYAVMTSINYKDKHFCVTRDITYIKVILFITEKYVSLKSTSGLCMKPCATNLASHNLIFLILFSDENSLEPDRIGPRRCRYYITKYFSFSR